jgi:ribosomal protein S18 acetylase RimI-like enzyme
MEVSTSTSSHNSDRMRVLELGLDDYARWMHVWRASGLHSVRARGRDSRRAFERQLQHGTHTMLGVLIGDELVGVVLATHDGRKGWINRLAVLPAFRRKGVARLLISEAERVLSSQGISVIAALIEPDNDSSLHLFHELGYVEPPEGMHYLTKRSSEDD